MNDTPFANRCSNAGFYDRWTCPGCYTDLTAKKPETIVCPKCKRKVVLSVDYEPVSVAELYEGDSDE